MLIPSISNETNQLQYVLLGIADQSGPTPKYEEAYDPKSRLHIAKGTYPEEQDLIDQLDFMQTALKKHGVEVLRPHIVHNCNQIFSRDIAFVVEDRLFISNILPARDKEIDAIQHILEQIPKDKILKIPGPYLQSVTPLGAILNSLEFVSRPTMANHRPTGTFVCF